MVAKTGSLSNINLDDVHSRILQCLQTAQYKEAERLSSWLVIQDVKVTANTYFYLGVALQFQGKVAQALEVFKTASNLDPSNINILQAIASCLEQLGEYHAAHAQLLRVLEIAAGDDGVYANLGAISERLGNGEEALSYYDKALSINVMNHTALLNKGGLLGVMGKRLDAVVHCQEAYQIHSNSIGILYNLTDALLNTYRYEEALAYSELGLAMQPRHANFLFKKGLILCCLQRFEEAHLCLAEAQIIDQKVLSNFLPHLAKKDTLIEFYLDPCMLYLDAMYQAQSVCFWLDRSSYIDQIVRLLEKDALSANLSNLEFAFQTLSLSLSGQQRLQITQKITDVIQDMTWLKAVAPFEYHQSKHDKIRIGYVSSDFRTHPTGLLSRQMYGLHDKEHFEVYVYSLYNAPKKDIVRIAVESTCTVFHDVSAMTEQAIAELINQDQIDILVDLNGYTAKARSEIFAMRPAPLQVQYLAYLQSMGADFIDYVILDAKVCTDKHLVDWQEQIVRLPHSFYVYDTETSNAPIQETRRDFGLPEDGFVYCCLNTIYKIDPQIFAVWMSILQAVPNSVIWLVTGDELAIQNLQNEAIKYGVAKERIVFAEPLPYTEHLLRYQLADLFIDTYWYGGHTTGLDALWQGLPVLCCVGEVPTSRVGASYQYVLEMPEMVAESFEEYQAKAIYYGTNPEALKEIIQKLKEKIRTTPLFDTPLTVKHIEKAYQMMWQRYQDGLPPATFDVPDIRVQH